VAHLREVLDVPVLVLRLLTVEGGEGGGTVTTTRRSTLPGTREASTQASPAPQS
jgi:hypothetical protein